MLLVWLGLVVWLNSEQRTWGIYLTSGGLLLGAGFFCAHSILLVLTFNLSNPWLEIWWKAGWVPIILSPCTWYMAILWYAGYWDDAKSALHRRHRPFLYIILILTVILFGSLFFNPLLPTYLESLTLNFSYATPTILGFPILIVILPAFIFLCIALAVDALMRPGPTRRLMADVARLRARPWLLASSIFLVVVSLLVGWVVFNLQAYLQSNLDISNGHNLIIFIAQADLLIAAIIGLSVLSVGQALVSYEIFTGKPLPRQGLRRHYYSAVLLFGVISLIIAGAHTLKLSAIYSLLLALVIATAYFALLTWRSFRERDRAIRQLRPFVGSQRLYDQLIDASSDSNEIDIAIPFRALCIEVLDTSLAALIPMGPLEPLVNQPLLYPATPAPVLPNLNEILPEITVSERIATPIDPEVFHGYAWVIPLWSERGLIGLFLLGNKNHQGFFTQEEIEVARASGERLIDAQAGLEIIRRLRDLQREQMISSQVIDRRTRRTLHDEILPALHASILKLNGSSLRDNTEINRVVRELADIHQKIASLLRDLPAPLAPDLQNQGLVAALRYLVQEDLAGLFDRTFFYQGENIEPIAEALPTLTADVLFYATREAMRNAAQHARGDKPLHLKVSITNHAGFEITIEDNGVGIAMSAHNSENKEGHGLALHSTLMAVIGGSLRIETKPTEYTRVILRI